MKYLIQVLAFACYTFSCNQIHEKLDYNGKDSSAVDIYYAKHCCNDQPSTSFGTPGKGSLTNGKLMPFSGSNFHYFDTLSYLNGRAYLHNKVKITILETYKSLFVQHPNDLFGLMECSHETGGQLFPHRTHQNGLSVDFMCPKLKDDKPYFGLDYIGRAHYFLGFDDSGRYTEDTSIRLNFDLMALHILELDQIARHHGLKIKKVILKMELKDEFYATPNGNKVKANGIYITKKLPPSVNRAHDDHFHVDFEFL